jgi:NitT/TauT family transport system substrate-binding protein
LAELLFGRSQRGRSSQSACDGLGVRDHRYHIYLNRRVAMAGQRENSWSRRKLLRGATLAGTAISLGLKSESAAAEPALETTRIRIHDAPITCFAPVYIAEGLLKAEGFTDVQYIKTPLNEGPTKALAEGKIDITQNDTAGHLMELDAGAPVVILGGIHTGCWELFVNDSVRTLRDLKGKTVAAPEHSSRQAFVAGLATFVGLNPLKDITWINHEPGKSMQLFAEGKSTPSWALRRSPRSCARRRSAAA